MANILTRRPPQYTGKDPYLQQVSEYLASMHQLLDHLLGQMQKDVKVLQSAAQETEE